MKKNGTVVLYDATCKTETVKISSSCDMSPGPCDYQLFVNGKEQICVMQSAPEAPSGRYINVYTYSGQPLYKINLDLYQYGLSRDESVCIYPNAAFLAAADSKRFVLFNVKNGEFLSVIHIPNHLERSKGNFFNQRCEREYQDRWWTAHQLTGWSLTCFMTINLHKKTCFTFSSTCQISNQKLVRKSRFTSLFSVIFFLKIFIFSSTN